MAEEVIVDALPYIDQGYEEQGVREAVRAFFLISNSKTVSLSIFQFWNSFFRLCSWLKKKPDDLGQQRTTWSIYHLLN